MRWINYFLFALLAVGSVAAATTITNTQINGVYYASSISELNAVLSSCENPCQIIMQPGTYTISSTITSSKSIELSGSSDSTKFIISGGVNGFQFSNKVTLHDFVVDGSGQTGEFDGIRLIAGSDESYIYNVRVENVTRAGIYSLGKKSVFSHNIFKNVGRSTEEGRGIWITSGADSSRLDSNIVLSSTRYGFLVDNSNYVTITNSFTNNTRRSNDSSGRGLFVDSSNYATIIGNTFSGAALTGINVGSSNYANIIGNTIYNISNTATADARGIEVDGGDHHTIVSNNIYMTDNDSMYINANNVSILSNILRSAPIGILAGSTRNDLMFIGNMFESVTTPYSLSSALEGGFLLDNRNFGLFTTKPASGLELNDGFIVGDSGNFATTKFDSQGAAWSSRSLVPSFVFNADSNDKPEISWLRGSRTYPQFSIRMSSNIDVGGEIYSGGGTSAPTLTVVYQNGRTNMTNATVYSLRGSGNDYVCVNQHGDLFRSNTAC